MNYNKIKPSSPFKLYAFRVVDKSVGKTLKIIKSKLSLISLYVIKTLHSKIHVLKVIYESIRKTYIPKESKLSLNSYIITQ